MKVYCSECKHIKNYTGWASPDCRKERVVYDTPFTQTIGYSRSPDTKNKNNDCPDYQIGFWGYIVKFFRTMRQKRAPKE